MRLSWTVIATLATRSLVASPALLSGDDPETTGWGSATGELVLNRLQNLELPIHEVSSEQVLKQVRMYLVPGRHGTEDILGRSKIYFPIIEHYLQCYELPDFLKYLPVVESALDPSATSPVGAVGLWQMMPATAREYGLIINSSVDERRDPFRASDAAARMLVDLYEQFGDWSLVLSAYNSGPGRVRRAIRSADSYDYANLQKFLPGETRRYLPTFLAVAYVSSFYGQHGLHPDLDHAQHEVTRTLLIRKRLSFNEIGEVTGMSNAAISRLNPSIQGSFVPEHPQGIYLRLPVKSAAFVKGMLAAKEIKPGKKGFKYEHVVSSGQSIKDLARVFKISPEDIMAWNELPGREVAVGQMLDLYIGRSYAMNR